MMMMTASPLGEEDEQQVSWWMSLSTHVSKRSPHYVCVCVMCSVMHNCSLHVCMHVEMQLGIDRYLIRLSGFPLSSEIRLRTDCMFHARLDGC